MHKLENRYFILRQHFINYVFKGIEAPDFKPAVIMKSSNYRPRKQLNVIESHNSTKSAIRGIESELLKLPSSRGNLEQLSKVSTVENLCLLYDQQIEEQVAQLKIQICVNDERNKLLLLLIEVSSKVFNLNVAKI